MKFSVWLPEHKQYDYYQTPTTVADSVYPQPKIAGGTRLGVSPEDAAWTLPSNAQKIGRGALPIGQVATTGSKPFYIPWYWFVGAGVFVIRRWL